MAQDQATLDVREVAAARAERAAAGTGPAMIGRPTGPADPVDAEAANEAPEVGEVGAPAGAWAVRGARLLGAVEAALETIETGFSTNVRAGLSLT